MNQKRKIVEIDEELCNGCGQCVPACEEGAIQIIDGKARLIADKYCDGLGNCLGECPTGALKIVERDAEEFDEEAVQELLRRQEMQRETQGQCPSAGIRSMTPCKQANIARTQADSALSHWPVQIKLVPPHAPFLKNAHLLITADCVPVAYANYHADFLQGKVALLGCPKFDDAEAYVQKFVDIFNNNELSGVTILMMEVPCCSGLLGIVQKAKEEAGVDVPIRQVVIGTSGDIIYSSSESKKDRVESH